MNDSNPVVIYFIVVSTLTILFLIIRSAALRHAIAQQKWVGTIHAAILHARAKGQSGPNWMEGLEDAFEEVYELTHGKAPSDEIIGRGIADMTNLICNHLFTHSPAEFAEHFHTKLNPRAVSDQTGGTDGVHVVAESARGNAEKKPLRSFSTLGLVLFCLCVSGFGADDKPEPIPATIESIAFAPNGSSKNGYGDCDCTATVVDVLDHAKKTVLMQAYNFTSEPIAKALCAAKKRGVDVKIIGDRSVPTERSSKAQDCADAAIPVLIDKKHHIAHNKVIVVDGETTITGSFNWTDSAEDNNAENLLVIKSAAIAAIYTANWKVHALHAEAFKKSE